jgi:hypothetical protein
MQKYWENRSMVPLFNLGTKWKLGKKTRRNVAPPKKKADVLKQNTVGLGGKTDARTRNYKPHI